MPKNILKKLFISLLLSTQIIFLLFFVFLPATAQAADNLPVWKNPFEDLQIKIPGMKKEDFSEPAPCEDDPSKTCVKWIGEYISGIYKYAIGVVGILAAVVLMWGGLNWLTAGGNQGRITEAKAWIGASITGLIIALSSYLILYQVNPDLVNLKAIGIAGVKTTPSTIISGCSWKPLADKTKDCTQFGATWKNGAYNNCPGYNPTTIDTTTGVPYGDIYNCCCPVITEVAGAGGGCGGFNVANAGNCADSSSSLAQFLSDYKNKQAINPTLTGLSDSAGLNKCRDNYTKPPCHHKQNSCHYGCGKMDGSYAVDFQCWSSNCYTTLESSAKTASNYKWLQCEDANGDNINCSSPLVNHIHIEVN